MTHAEKLNRIYVCGAEDKFRDVSELRRADLAFVKLMNKAEQAALPADEHIGSQTKLAIEYFKSSFLVGDIVSVPNDLFTCAQLSAPPPVLMPEISDAHYVATLRLKGVEFTPQGSSFIQVVDPRPESKTKVQIAGKRYSPSVRPTVRPSAVRPSVRPSVRHVRPSVRPSDRPSVRPSVRPPVRSVRPSVRPTDRPTVRPSARPLARPPTRPIVISFKIIKSSSDALDGLPGADRWGVIEAVLNSSFQKGHLQANKCSRKCSPPKTFKNRPPDHISG